VDLQYIFGRGDIHTLSLEDVKGQGYFVDLGVDRRIILRHINGVE
jgi:hypothetical protein